MVRDGAGRGADSDLECLWRGSAQGGAGRGSVPGLVLILVLWLLLLQFVVLWRSETLLPGGTATVRPSSDPAPPAPLPRAHSLPMAPPSMTQSPWQAQALGQPWVQERLDAGEGGFWPGESPGAGCASSQTGNACSVLTSVA